MIVWYFEIPDDTQKPGTDITILTCFCFLTCFRCSQDASFFTDLLTLYAKRTVAADRVKSETLPVFAFHSVSITTSRSPSHPPSPTSPTPGVSWQRQRKATKMFEGFSDRHWADWNLEVLGLGKPCLKDCKILNIRLLVAVCCMFRRLFDCGWQTMSGSHGLYSCVFYSYDAEKLQQLFKWPSITAATQRKHKNRYSQVNSSEISSTSSKNI